MSKIGEIVYRAGPSTEHPCRVPGMNITDPGDVFRCICGQYWRRSTMQGAAYWLRISDRQGRRWERKERRKARSMRP